MVVEGLGSRKEQVKYQMYSLAGNKSVRLCELASNAINQEAAA